MILETERTYLRKIEQSDFSALCKILRDKEVMYAYEHAFSCEEVQEWLDKQLKRYNEDGFGLWAVILKDTNEMISGIMDMQRKQQSHAKNMHLMF